MEAKLAAVRAAAEHPVDPATGRPFFQPAIGRAPHYRRNQHGLPVGDYLYGMRYIRSRRCWVHRHMSLPPVSPLCMTIVTFGHDRSACVHAQHSQTGTAAACLGICVASLDAVLRNVTWLCCVYQPVTALAV